jgi:hypothetical protein
MAIETEYTSAPISSIRIHRYGSLPKGFSQGAHVSRGGDDWYYVIRNSDDSAVLCHATPCDNEVLPARKLAAALHEACDEANTNKTT